MKDVTADDEEGKLLNEKLKQQCKLLALAHSKVADGERKEGNVGEAVDAMRKAAGV